MTLHVGTSGWDYPEWRGTRGDPAPGFYPAGLPRSRFLGHYSSVLSACEVNATFYKLPPDHSVALWAKTVPRDFRFALKAHRALTHGKSIAPPVDRLETLTSFAASARVLGPRLGAVLFQFPPHRARDDDELERLIRLMQPGPRLAFEFRHDSWVDAALDRRIAEAGATRCLSETEGKVSDELPPGPIAYVRLRGDRYGPRTRARWRRLLARESAARDVYVFTKHKGAPPDDPFAGVGLACWLERHR